MQRNILLLTAVAMLLLVIAVQGQVCQPGSVFRVKCNTCRCNLLGTDMACTRKECPPDYDDFPFRQKICEPGSFFKRDCNDCRCNEDGTNAACTLKACLPE